MQTIDIFAPTAVQQTYLRQKLEEVSRSFALVVPFLEVPLRHYLATAYLLCRVVDNIEDSGRDETWKIERFDEFSRLLQEPYHAADVLSSWQSEEWPALTDQEHRMMGVKEGIELWRIFGAIPPATQAIIRLWAGIMAEGMKQLSDPVQRPAMVRRDGIDILETETAYNTYCYYVAGTVGHMVTELVNIHYMFPEAVAQPLRQRAEACGRALQKTNIIKDFREDLERGISYLPDAWLIQAEYAPLMQYGASPEWKEMVLNDVLAELRDATDYLVALPYDAPGYRRAALLCLLPAYQTILTAALRQDILFTREHHIKISRMTMAQCLADSQTMLYDNESLRQYSRRVQDEIHESFRMRVI